MFSFLYSLRYQAPDLVITDVDHNYLIDVLLGSNVFDEGDSTPDSDGAFEAAVIDIRIPAAEDGSGVLSRFTIDTAGAAPGIYGLTLRKASHVDPAAQTQTPSLLNYSFLAVDDSCLNLSFPPIAVGGVAGLLEADDHAATTASRSDNTGYVAALAGIVSAALIAGGWYARRRWLR